MQSGHLRALTLCCASLLTFQAVTPVALALSDYDGGPLSEPAQNFTPADGPIGDDTLQVERSYSYDQLPTGGSSKLAQQLAYERAKEHLTNQGAALATDQTGDTPGALRQVLQRAEAEIADVRHGAEALGDRLAQTATDLTVVAVSAGAELFVSPAVAAEPGGGTGKPAGDGMDVGTVVGVGTVIAAVATYGQYRVKRFADDLDELATDVLSSQATKRALDLLPSDPQWIAVGGDAARRQLGYFTPLTGGTDIRGQVPDTGINLALLPDSGKGLAAKLSEISAQITPAARRKAANFASTLTGIISKHAPADRTALYTQTSTLTGKLADHVPEGTVKLYTEATQEAASIADALANGKIDAVVADWMMGNLTRAHYQHYWTQPLAYQTDRLVDLALYETFHAPASVERTQLWANPLAIADDLLKRSRALRGALLSTAFGVVEGTRQAVLNRLRDQEAAAIGQQTIKQELLSELATHHKRGGTHADIPLLGMAERTDFRDLVQARADFRYLAYEYPIVSRIYPRVYPYVERALSLGRRVLSSPAARRGAGMALAFAGAAAPFVAKAAVVGGHFAGGAGFVVDVMSPSELGQEELPYAEPGTRDIMGILFALQNPLYVLDQPEAFSREQRKAAGLSYQGCLHQGPASRNLAMCPASRDRQDAATETVAERQARLDREHPYLTACFNRSGHIGALLTCGAVLGVLSGGPR